MPRTPAPKKKVAKKKAAPKKPAAKAPVKPTKEVAVEAPKKALVPRESNRAVAPRNQGVAGGKRGLEQVEESDLTIAFAKLVQPLSPENLDKEDVAEFGDICNSLTGFCYGDKIHFIPLMLRKRRIKWIPRDDGGGIDCMSQNFKNPSTGAKYESSCVNCEFSSWNGDEPPGCDSIITFPALILGLDDEDQSNRLVALSFTRTSFKTGKKLISLASYAAGDVFNNVYELSTEVINGEYTYAKFNVEPVGVVEEGEYAEAEELFDVLNKEQFKIDDRDLAGDFTEAEVVDEDELPV
jgi:hypothetical protein